MFDPQITDMQERSVVSFSIAIDYRHEDPESRFLELTAFFEKTLPKVVEALKDAGVNPDTFPLFYGNCLMFEWHLPNPETALRLACDLVNHLEEFKLKVGIAHGQSRLFGVKRSDGEDKRRKRIDDAADVAMASIRSVISRPSQEAAASGGQSKSDAYLAIREGIKKAIETFGEPPSYSWYFTGGGEPVHLARILCEKSSKRAIWMSEAFIEKLLSHRPTEPVEKDNLTLFLRKQQTSKNATTSFDCYLLNLMEGCETREIIEDAKDAKSGLRKRLSKKVKKPPTGKDRGEQTRADG